MTACVIPEPGATSALHVGTSTETATTAAPTTSTTDASSGPDLATVTGVATSAITSEPGTGFVFFDLPPPSGLPPYPPMPCDAQTTCPLGTLCIDLDADGPGDQSGCVNLFDPAYGCDVSEQDCPTGYKCVLPWSFYGNGWSGACVPIVQTPVDLAGPCSVLDPYFTDEDADSLVYPDDCPAGSQCMTVGDNCAVFCMRTEDFNEPVKCPLPDHYCGVMRQSTWCIEMCDPLVQDCPDGDTCTFVDWVPGCFLDWSGEEGQVFDPCFDSRLCDPGLLCLDPSAADECDPNEQGCCLPYCNLEAPDCPGVGQECHAYFEPGDELEGLEHLGYCAQPW